MQIQQKASAMTNKKPVCFSQALPSRFISFSKIRKNYHIHTKPIKRLFCFTKITFLHIALKSRQSTKRIKCSRQIA